MKFRGRTEETETREEVREMAEALSLFGSAMRHMADRRAERMARPRAAKPAGSFRLRLMLAPALGAAVAVAVALPVWSHIRHDRVTAARQAPGAGQQENNAGTRASMNDTALMNQIDSDVSQEVPGALEPLAQLSEQAAATKTTSGTEKKNDAQE